MLRFSATEQTSRYGTYYAANERSEKASLFRFRESKEYQAWLDMTQCSERSKNASTIPTLVTWQPPFEWYTFFMHETRTGRLPHIFDGIARLLLIGVCATIPFFFLPVSWSALAQSKMSLIVVAVVSTAIIWVVARAAEGVLYIPRAFLFFVGALLPLVYVISTGSVGWSSGALVGQGIEQDTLAAMVLWYALLSLSALLFSHNKESLLSGIQALLGGILAVQLFQILHVLFPEVFTFPSMLLDATSNLVGSWHDVGIIAGLGVCMSLALWSNSDYARSRWLFVLVGIVSLSTLFLVHFTDTFWVTGAATLAAGLILLIGALRHGVSLGHALSRSAVWFVLAALMLVGALWGTDIAEKYPESIRITQVEVRPSWQGTLDVAKQSLDAPSSILFGSGPNSFIRAWSQHKPTDVNLTPFWDTDFNLGVGIIPTSIFTAGLLGLLAWLALVLSLGTLVWSSVRGSLHSGTLSLQTMLAISVVFLFAFHVVYTPGVALTALLFILIGALIAAVTMDRQAIAIRLGVQSSMELVALLLLVVSVGAIILSAGLMGREIVSNLYVNKAAVTYAQSQDASQASALIARALSLSPNNDRAHRAATELGLVQLAALAQNPDTTNQEAITQLQTTLQTTIEHGLTAVSIDQADYQNWLSLATVYANLAGVNVEGSIDQAIKAYESASQASPKNPTPKMRLAQLALAKNDIASTEKYLDEAIALKPDLALAHYLKSQIYASKGNVEGAVQEAAVTAQLTPQEPLAWFNLGYILYASQNFRDAGAALEQAVALRPEYANALFILGITYHELDMDEPAIEAFRRVGQLNPSETWLLTVIDNIQKGNELFAGVEAQAQSAQSSAVQ